MRHRTLQIALVLFAILPNAKAAESTTIKSVGIGGPITGGQETVGRLDLQSTGTVLATVVIELRSSNPRIAEVPQRLKMADTTSGVRAIVDAQLTGWAPPAGASIDVHYSGDTQISGPARVQIASNQTRTTFTVTVSSCSVKPTCAIVVTASYLDKQIQATGSVTR